VNKSVRTLADPCMKLAIEETNSMSTARVYIVKNKLKFKCRNQNRKKSSNPAPEPTQNGTVRNTDREDPFYFVTPLIVWTFKKH
jgi:hypothetical protein